MATPYRRQEYRRVDSHTHSMSTSMRGQSAEPPSVPLQTLSSPSAAVVSDLEDQTNSDVSTQLIVGSTHAHVTDRRKYPDTLVSQIAASESHSSIPPTTGDSPGIMSKSKFRWKHIVHTWWAEATCCILVIGSLIGLAITLSFHQQRPLPAWPYSLTINSVISLFILVFKSSALFVLCQGISQLKWSWFSKTKRPLKDIVTYDDASRGVWGAASLIWKLKLRDLIATLAAFIMIVALALDPLAQQLIKFYSCEQSFADAQPKIPRSQRFSEHGDQLTPIVVSVSPGVMSVVQGGAYVVNTLPLDWHCPTGHCESNGSYGTLGWCSYCNDVSHELDITSGALNISYVSGNWFKASLPSGSYAHTNINTDYARPLTAQLALDGSTEFVYMATYFTSDHQGTNCPDSPCSPDRSDSTTSWCCRGYGAARCRSNMCAREYNATVTNGSLAELELSRIDMEPGNEAQTYAVRMSCLTEQQRSDLITQSYNISSDMRWLEYKDLSSASDSTVNTSMVPEQCRYSIYLPTWTTINAYVSDLFPGSLTLAPAVKSYLTIQGPDLLTKLYDGGKVEYANIETAFTGTSAALDRYIRQHGDANYSASATGIVYGSSTCLRVQWPWMILPATFTLLLLLFFAAMIIQTTPRRMRTAFDAQNFKASPLALLFHGLSLEATEWSNNNFACADTKEMEKAAESMFVQFSQSGRGWHFVEDGVVAGKNQSNARVDAAEAYARS